MHVCFQNILLNILQIHVYMIAYINYIHMHTLLSIYELKHGEDMVGSLHPPEEETQAS